jgi:antitoxin (DNA-binding transcriptional repressor) of toxin-antitoxin stability system
MVERVQVTMHEAQSQLPQLAERAWHGDTVVIVKDGKPYLDLVPHVETPRARKPGRLKGEMRISTKPLMTSLMDLRAAYKALAVGYTRVS